MTEPAVLLLLVAMGTVATGVIAVALLNAWQGWLEVRRMEIDRRRGRSPAARTELGELRDRIRRLEGIANGG